ncbi:uncharacterized protein LOC116291393 isoform X2 [Actinia tenebrosa]|uniref:Uncharacterized protein LOC116291393 isoform X2 n=1 Tax=Actinia tenebrosa TaxID=6105 RepID=A0A6P8HF88_ACTTE|nr:uncharacterized protein LOC116291393 isoform X2 [Actinia tenebrosa]
MGLYTIVFAMLGALALLLLVLCTLKSRWHREKPITSLGRKDLEDDGTRSWDEEGERFLSAHYPNWKQLEHTIMVPDIIQGGEPLTYARNENEESKVFDLLKKFGNETKQPMFVVHAHSFCELVSYHKTGIVDREKTKWIQGEHDFVIIHRQYGLIFLEVKSREKTKEVFKQAEKQIEKAKRSVENYLKKRFGKSKERNEALYTFPGFVVMPNCPRPKQSASHENGIFKEDCNVDSFKVWWEKVIAKPEKPQFESKVYEELVKKYVLFICSAPALNQQIDKTHDKIVKVLTPNQLKSWYKTLPEQWISGPAGSGKTVLLIEKVKQIAEDITVGEHQQERILVLCCSVPLSIHLNNEISDWFNSEFPSKTCPVHVKTYDSFINEIEKESVTVRRGQKNLFLRRRLEVETKLIERLPEEFEHRYEHIFVDEGQDMFLDKWPVFLKKLHRTPVASRRYYFWIMYDSNQHLQRKEINRSFLDKITRNTSQLTEVLRNTKNIFSLTNKYYKGIYEGEISLGHQIIGLEVKYDNQLSKKNLLELVDHHVKKLRESNVEHKDIAVLVRSKRIRDNCIKHLKKEKYNLRCVTVENRLREKENAIALDTIKEFKGLESKVVILCDPQYKPNNADTTREFLYTAVSRCFCYLIIISTNDGCKRIETASIHDDESVLRENREYSSEDFES